MKERPILFSAPMVRAILDGSKTQTRRIVKPQPIIQHIGADDIMTWCGPQWWMEATTRQADVPSSVIKEMLSASPYGPPGDRLWVRETFRITTHTMEEARALTEDISSGTAVDYRATYIETCKRELGFSQQEAEIADDFEQWRPSIHMPRWASRILLEVTGVRVERLQDISDADAVAEGTPCYVCGGRMDGRSESDCHCFHRKATASDYQNLWEQINGQGSWDANPLVWVVEFKRV